MKILHVITSLGTGGAEHLMVDLLPRLAAMGHEVELCVFDGSRTPFYGELEAKGITIHALGIGGNVYHPRNIWRLMRLIQRGKYDVVHTHNTACQLFAPLAKRLHFGKERLLTTEHNTTNRRRDNAIYRPIDWLMYRGYERIICISDAAWKSLVDYMPSLGKRAIVVENGVDVERFANAEPSPEPKSSRKVVMMVAGFRVQKDQSTLLRAMAELDADKYELWLVGDGDTRPAMEDLAAELGIQERVRFLGVRTDVPGLLKCADVVVMSSHWEGLSLSNIEGMASGRPFVASAVRGLREITDGHGLLFEHENSTELASVIRQLCDDETLYKEVVARCIAQAKRFDISNMARGYAAIYEGESGAKS